MRCFFFVFGLFLWGLLCGMPISALSGQKTETELSPIAQVFTDFDDAVKQWQHDLNTLKTKTQEHKPSGVLENLYLLTHSEYSPFSGTKGYGKWYDYPFGRMRLVSCRTDLQKNAPVFVDVQMQIKPDWYLNKPVIELKTPSKQHVVTYPLLHPLPAGVTRTDFYAETVMFPIFFIPMDYEKPLDVLVNVSWQAHNPDHRISLKDETLLELTLSNGTSYETGICAYMNQQLRLAPAPLNDTAKISAVLDKTGDIQLFFDFHQKTKELFVQIDAPWTFRVVHKNISGQTASLVIRPSVPQQEGCILPLKVITSFGTFDAPTHLKQGSFQTTMPTFSFSLGIINGLILFLMTPLLSLFLLSSYKTKNQMVKNASLAMWSILCIGFICTLLWHSGLLTDLSGFLLLPYLDWIYIGVLIWVLLYPNRTILGALLLTLIFPKPYLEMSLLTAQGWEIIFIGTVWTVICSLPFRWIMKYPNGFYVFYNLLKKEYQSVKNIVRLPIIAWILWAFIGGPINARINKDISLYMPQAVHEVIKQGKMAFVSIENPICFSCALNKGVFLKTGFAGPLTDGQKLFRFYLPADTFSAKELMRMHGQFDTPTNILLSPQTPNGMLLPSLLTYDVLYRYLKK